MEGGTDQSYGIHVARLAGLPRPVIARAYEILEVLEQHNLSVDQENQKKEVNQLLRSGHYQISLEGYPTNLQV